MRTCGQVYEKTPATAMTLEEACSMARRKHQGPVVVFPEVGWKLLLLLLLREDPSTPSH